MVTTRPRKKPATLSAREAVALGKGAVTLAGLRYHLKSGRIKQAGDGRIVRESFLAWLQSRQAAQDADPRRRFWYYRAERERMRCQVESGALVSLPEITAEGQKLVLSCRNRLLALPSQLAAELPLPSRELRAAVFQAAEECIRRVLTELADGTSPERLRQVSTAGALQLPTEASDTESTEETADHADPDPES